MFTTEKKRNQQVTIKDENKEMGSFIGYLSEELFIGDNKFKFIDVQDKSLLPGVLVMINGADWELMDTNKYILQDNDEITFISTLHGG
mmetsp:Transcript_30066/g.65749  ORF Transcript_30066/g.65749 Transcript_30066/m.65749 type:complete len:88 (+) Transcript_30066:8-271(+)